MAKAKIVESASELLAAVEKSGLLSGNSLETARTICAGTDDAKIAARKLITDGILTHWQANQLLAGFTGLGIGKYGLLEFLSKSDLGRVYLAKQLALNQKVALYAISSKSISDSKRVERFLNDLRIVSALDHPRIARVIEVSSDRDRHVVVTEPICEDLQQRVEKKGPLAIPVAIEFIAQAAEGLGHLHQNQVVHLDLKPANLTIDERGRVKVREVGFAHLQNPTESPGMAAQSYAAPEVVAAQPADHRADIFSLGRVLLFLLTGKSTAAGSAEALGANRPEVSVELIQLCKQMLAESPNDRPATMDEVGKQLRSIRVPVTPVPVTPFEPVEQSVTQPDNPWSVQTDESDVEGNETADVEDDANVDSEAIPDAELAGFKVKKKPRETPATADGTKTSNSVEQTAKKQQTRKLLMIIGVAAMLLILVTGGVVALMSMGSGEQVATKSVPTAVKAEPPPIIDPYGGGPPIVAVDAGLSTVAPSSALTTMTGAPAAVDASAPATSGTTTSPAATSTAPAAPPAVPTAPAVPAPAGTPSAEPASTASAPMAVSAPEQKAATTPVPAVTTKPDPPAETKPDTKTETKPATPPEPKPESKPETKPEPKPAEKSESKPAEPAPPKKGEPPARTFEIAGKVDLPRLPAADGSGSESPNKILGRINADPKAGCFISLLGGETAMKGKTEFALRSAQGGTAPRDWEFLVREAADAETVLAKLSLPQQELMFEWTPDGMKHASAPHLQNCALRISVGQEKPHVVALRTPKGASPLSLGTLEKSPLTIKFDVDSLPDPAALQVEAGSKEIKLALEPASPSDKNRSDQWLYLGEGGAQSLLHLRMATSSTPKGIQITLTPYLVLPQEKPQRLTPALRKSLPIGVLQEQKRMVENRMAELAKIPKEKQNAGDRDQLTVTKTLLDEKLKKLQQFDDVMQKLGTAHISLRVYHEIPDAPVDLVVTGS